MTPETIAAPSHNRYDRMEVAGAFGDLEMMAQNWWIAGPALLCTSLVLTNRVIPAMFPAAHVRRDLRSCQ